MSKVKVDHLHKLLYALHKKTGLELSTKNLQTISEKIEGIGSDYLYWKIQYPIKDKKKNDTIGLRITQLDNIARYLGFENFQNFIAHIELDKDPQIMSLIGNYYSYVRRNSEKENYILRSPVKIEQRKDGKIEFQLKGPAYTFRGEIYSKKGCIFILMKADEGKVFHHIYKIGDRQTPSVMQGVFSGVSTAFDPIGGRTVLVRTEEPYTSLKNASLSVHELRRSKMAVEKRLAVYFKEYSNNNIAPNRSSTFGISDL
jgi:hypothetical protein